MFICTNICFVLHRRSNILLYFSISCRYRNNTYVPPPPSASSPSLPSAFNDLLNSCPVRPAAPGNVTFEGKNLHVSQLDLVADAFKRTFEVAASGDSGDTGKHDNIGIFERAFGATRRNSDPGSDTGSPDAPDADADADAESVVADTAATESTYDPNDDNNDEFTSIAGSDKIAGHQQFRSPASHLSSAPMTPRGPKMPSSTFSSPFSPASPQRPRREAEAHCRTYHS
jgi:hypothetical protein